MYLNKQLSIIPFWRWNQLLMPQFFWTYLPSLTILFVLSRNRVSFGDILWNTTFWMDDLPLLQQQKWNDWRFRTWFCTVWLNWAGDKLYKLDELCSESCHWWRTDCSTCWPAAHRTTTEPRMPPPTTTNTSHHAPKSHFLIISRCNANSEIQLPK